MKKSNIALALMTFQQSHPKLLGVTKAKAASGQKLSTTQENEETFNGMAKPSLDTTHMLKHFTSQLRIFNCLLQAASFQSANLSTKMLTMC